MNLGDFDLGATIDFQWTTSVAGVPTTLGGSPSLAVYAGNNTTEITSGLALTVDFDDKTGTHNIRILATSGNGFATATNYTLWLMAGTLGATTIAPRVIALFSVENRNIETITYAAAVGATSPSAISAQTIVTGALQLIGVLAESETPSYGQVQDGFRRLNMMVRSWALQPRTLLITEREVFDMTAGKGSTSNPYTIGPGGNLNTERPVAIRGAATLLTTSTPNVETPLSVYTDAGYGGLPIKALSNGMAAGVWYQPTAPLGLLYLYPVPDVATHDLVLYLQKPLVSFAAVTTGYDLPDGVEEALEYNLAVRLCASYSVPVPLDVAGLARSSLAVLKRSTYQLVDLPSPFGAGGFYDINSDTIR